MRVVMRSVFHVGSPERPVRRSSAASLDAGKTVDEAAGMRTEPSLRNVTLGWAAVLALVVAVAGTAPRVAAGPSTRATQAGGTVGAAPPAAFGAGSATIEGRFVVRYADREALDRAMTSLDTRGLAPTRLSDHGLFALSVRLPDARTPRLEDLGGAISIEPDRIMTASSNQSGPPWGLDRIDQRNLPLNNTYSYGASGAGVDVYVIDSGIWHTHTEFTGRIPRSAYWDFGDSTQSWDCNGHGTHTAGTAAGSTYGVAKAASIIPVKVLNCSGSTTDSILIAAIDWILADHLNGVPAVANLSLGGSASSAVDLAVQSMIDDGITVVVAAGNDAANTCLYSPARLPAAITVAASTIADDDAPYSNYGSCNDIFAPGSGILSAWAGSNTATNTIDGTSMAAPHVTGAAAIALQSSPTATPAQVWATINANATLGVLSECCGDPDKLLYIPPPPPVQPTQTLSVSLAGSGAGTVTSSPAGISCTVSCSGVFASGTTVTLFASPGPNSTFVGWSTPCSGVGSCQVSMTTARSVTATFAGPPVGTDYQAVTPMRLMDTRAAGITVDGFNSGMGQRPAGSITELQITGRAAIPGDASAVVLNVTAVTPAAGGWITVYPCGSAPPNASNLNFTTGVTIPNAVIVKIGNAGRVCFYTSATTHLIVDVNGWHPSSPVYVSLDPKRLMDTRPIGSTVDGQNAAQGQRSAGSITELQITGRADIPTDASAVVLNVTAVTPAAGGWITVYPCGSAPPNASNLNFTTGVTIPNAVIVKIGNAGRVCFYTSATTHLIVDVGGYYPSPS